MYRMNFNPYQSLDLDLHIIMFSLMINMLKNITDRIEDILTPTQFTSFLLFLITIFCQ
jgi:hypothetical protein